MAEFLIKAQDAPVPDSPAKWYAARIVVVQEDGWAWGTKEVPPNFYLIKVPGVSKADAEQYLEEWRHNTTISIVSSNPGQDKYRLMLNSDRVSASGQNAFSLAQIENFFSDWNAEIITFGNDSVTFDVTVYDAITSRRFWDADVSSVVFVETSYNQGTGDHFVQVQSSPFSNEVMRHAVETKGGTIIPPDSFVMNRSVARQKLVEDIQERIKEISYARRRWYVTVTGMSALQSAGGILTITPAQFLANVADSLDD